jgi:Family of unknown function (DUF6502)
LKQKKTDQGIENSLLQFFLPVARLLVTEGAGIDKLVRAAKRAYLRAAVEAVIPKGKRENISLLSVATGMTRKEISILLKDSNDNRNTFTKARGEQRALRVFRGWLTDPRFHNRRGRADTLVYRGHAKSFINLVKIYGADVTPKSVQHELERMGLVKVTPGGVLRLRATRKRNAIEAYQLADLARLFEDFAFAITRPKPESEAPAFFGFKDFTVSSAGDAAYFMSRFSRRAAVLLEDFGDWSAGRESQNPQVEENEAVRVGLGVYLLRSDRAPEPNTENSAHGRAIRRSLPKRRR